MIFYIFLSNIFLLALLISAWLLVRRYIIRWLCRWLIHLGHQASIPDLLTQAHHQRLINEKEKFHLLKEFGLEIEHA